MVFNSFNFWLLFPFVFILYWLIPKRYGHLRKFLLLFVSYLLYCLFKPAFALVLLYVSFVTFSGALWIDKEGQAKKKLIFILALLSVMPLLTFKYYNFINDNISVILQNIGLHPLPGLNWAIPVGISFYTFQALGYLFDVYYKRIRKERSLLDYMLFVSFFPQVASGPINKAAELLPQIKKYRVFDYAQGVRGLQYLLWGMFLKVVVADRLGIYVDNVYANYSYYSGVTCFIASIFYSFQIYADFAGYSLMAIGIAKTLGFDLINNFRQPYFSVSITEFWRRWHISLSRWLKDYVYIPLGGSRCSKLKSYCNIMVTFLVSGIWHGASWTFVLWGLFHGLSQVIEKAIGGGKIQVNGLFNLPRIFVTFLLVNLFWMLFRADNIDQFAEMVRKIIVTPVEGQFLTDYIFFYFRLIAYVLIVDFLIEKNIIQRIMYKYLVVRWAAYVFLLLAIIGYGVLDSNQFIYVSF